MLNIIIKKIGKILLNVGFVIVHVLAFILSFAFSGLMLVISIGVGLVVLGFLIRLFN